jgi:DNA-binding HxlR family transcriptional regulator
MEAKNKTGAETFDERCPMYQLFDLLGKKWIFFILILIKQDCSTFNVILKKIPKLNPKILSERLDLLVEE